MVKIAVLVKMSPDVSQLKVDPQTREPRLAGLPWKVSDFDKHAIEAAVQLKEKKMAEKVVAYSYNPGPNGANLIKEPLAMGCDEAVLVEGPDTDGGGVAKALAKALQADGGYDLVFCAEVSLDRVAAETGSRLAAVLGVPSLFNVQAIESVQGGKIKAVRDGDPSEVVEAPLPVVCTMNDEINHPRLPPLMQILQAGKKPVRKRTAQELGLTEADLQRRMRMVENKAPKQDRKNIVLQGDDAVEKLIEALRKEGLA